MELSKHSKSLPLINCCIYSRVGEKTLIFLFYVAWVGLACQVKKSEVRKTSRQFAR